MKFLFQSDKKVTRDYYSHSNNNNKKPDKLQKS